MGSFGGWEIFWIVLIVLLLFGAKRIPEMMKSMGQGVKEFKKAAKDITNPDDESSSPAPAKPASPAPPTTDNSKSA
jgi:sec-independent protein translocase protein TatA